MNHLDFQPSKKLPLRHWSSKIGIIFLKSIFYIILRSGPLFKDLLWKKSKCTLIQKFQTQIEIRVLVPLCPKVVPKNPRPCCAPLGCVRPQTGSDQRHKHTAVRKHFDLVARVIVPREAKIILRQLSAPCWPWPQTWQVAVKPSQRLRRLCDKTRPP